METKHTPGPWKLRKPLHPGSHYRFEVLKADRNGIYKPYVADVRSMDSNGDDNSEANARLIAAAPDLLAALEALTESAAVVAEQQRMAGKLRLDCAAARAAIARAKGES